MNGNDTWKHILQWFPVKCMGGIVLAGWESQLWMLGAFSLLVIIDCVTRWLAISSGLLQKSGVAHPSLWDMVRYVPTARRMGYINSRTMKQRGVEKLVLYNLCVLTGACADYLIAFPVWDGRLSELAVSYLAMTEALSIVENLSDAGIRSMTELRKRLQWPQDR